jgi:hypothetical protein
MAAGRSDGETARAGLIVGGAFAATSAVCFIIAALNRQPATWRFWVTGNVVEETRPAPVASPSPVVAAPPAADPESRP